jgi:hypothetical protein
MQKIKTFFLLFRSWGTPTCGNQTSGRDGSSAVVISVSSSVASSYWKSTDYNAIHGLLRCGRNIVSTRW